MTNFRLLLERTNESGNEIILKSSEQDAYDFDLKLNQLNEKWKNLISLINELKEKYAASTQQQSQSNMATSSQSQQTTLNSFQLFSKKMNEHHEWQWKCEQSIEKNADKWDDLENEKLIVDLKEFQADLPFRQTIFQSDLNKFESKFETNKEIEMASTTSNNVLEIYEKVCKF